MKRVPAWGTAPRNAPHRGGRHRKQPVPPAPRQAGDHDVPPGLVDARQAAGVAGRGRSAEEQPEQGGTAGVLRFTLLRPDWRLDPWPAVFLVLWVSLPLVIGAVRAGRLASGRWVLLAELLLWVPTATLALVVVGGQLRGLLRRSARRDRAVPFVVRGRTRAVAVVVGPLCGCWSLFELLDYGADPVHDPVETIVAFGGMGVFLIVWTIMIVWRQRLEVRDDALVVVQRLSSISIPWQRVEDIGWDTLNPDTMDYHYRLQISTDRGTVVSRVPTTRNRDSGLVAHLRSQLLALAGRPPRGDDAIVVSGLGRWTAGLK